MIGAEATRRTTEAKGECKACGIARTVIGLALQLVGSILLSFGVAYALRLATGGATAQARAYFQEACTGCPPDVALHSVEVQARQGSSLFVIGGTWPDSVDRLHEDVRLVANDVEIVLHPVSTGFQIVKATKAGAALAPDSIAAGLQQGYLLIDVADSALASPVSLEFGMWSGSAYQGRLPATGRLSWDGHGAPKTATAP